MKSILTKLLCILCCLSTIQNIGDGAEYSPIVQILGEKGESSSGVVYKELNGVYYILGAAHNPPKTVTFFGKIGKSKTGFNTTATTLKLNKDIDLVHCTAESFGWVEVKPMEISKESLVPGQEAISLGYVTGGDILRNNVKVIDYTSYRTLGGAQILSCSGKRIYGLSGGPLVYKDKVYGIQSSGSDDTVLYCPADQIWNLIKDD